MNYAFKIYNRAEDQVWELPYEKVTIKEALNRGIDGNASVPYPSLKIYADALDTTPDNIISGGFRSWRLYVDDTMLYRGVLSQRTISGGGAGVTAITVNFTDYIGFLGSRYTPLFDYYPSTEDSADIAWSIIDDSQNDSGGQGDLGITRGTHPTTKDRQRTFRHDNIRDALVGMSAAKVADGYDMDIDTTLNFNIYYPKGTSRPEIVFSQFNIRKFSLSKPLAAKLINRVHVLGAGNADEMVTSTRENATVQTTWGLLEGTLAEKGVADTSELADRGDRYLERVAEPKDTTTITTSDTNLTSYAVGDTVRVIIEELSFDDMLRIDSRTLEILPNGQATVTLGFEEA